MSRLARAWRAAFGGDIGAIGWCGQQGFWWTVPCECSTVAHGCGWFDGERIVWGGA